MIVINICWGVTLFESLCWTVKHTSALNKHDNPVTDKYVETQTIE